MGFVLHLNLSCVLASRRWSAEEQINNPSSLASAGVRGGGGYEIDRADDVVTLLKFHLVATSAPPPPPPVPLYVNAPN